MTQGRSLEEHRQLVEAYLEQLPFAQELGSLVEAMRYSLDGGGKRIRPVLCLAAGEALGTQAEELLPAAAAVELVHTFGMVHDDLPSLDDDDVRRGRATSHVQFDEATAILNGDALLAQAFELVLSYPRPEVARELARAAVGCALAVAAVSGKDAAPWRGFAEDFGLLYQVVDDLLDGDGFVETLGRERAASFADELESRARSRLDEISADTTRLDELLSGLKSRATAS